MLSEKELAMYHARGKKIEVTCKDGTVVKGVCEIFTQALDNEPEVAEISIRRFGGYIGITEPEIDKIEYVK